MCVTFVTLVKCVCVAFVAVAGRRYTYTVCTNTVYIVIKPPARLFIFFSKIYVLRATVAPPRRVQFIASPTVETRESADRRVQQESQPSAAVSVRPISRPPVLSSSSHFSLCWRSNDQIRSTESGYSTCRETEDTYVYRARATGRAGVAGHTRSSTDTAELRFSGP